MKSYVFLRGHIVTSASSLAFDTDTLHDFIVAHGQGRPLPAAFIVAEFEWPSVEDYAELAASIISRGLTDELQDEALWNSPDPSLETYLVAYREHPESSEVSFMRFFAEDIAHAREQAEDAGVQVLTEPRSVPTKSEAESA